jgi:hypothetical protein
MLLELAVLTRTRYSDCIPSHSSACSICLALIPFKQSKTPLHESAATFYHLLFSLSLLF